MIQYTLETCKEILEKLFGESVFKNYFKNYEDDYDLMYDVSYVCDKIMVFRIRPEDDLDTIVDIIRADETAMKILAMGLKTYCEANKFWAGFHECPIPVTNQIYKYSLIYCKERLERFYKEIGKIVSKKRLFDYRDAYKCNVSLCSNSLHGIVYITKDCYCFNKTALTTLAKRLDVNFEELISYLELGKEKYSVNSSVTITDKNTGKKYRRDVFRIEKDKLA